LRASRVGSWSAFFRRAPRNHRKHDDCAPCRRTAPSHPSSLAPYRCFAAKAYRCASARIDTTGHKQSSNLLPQIRSSL
jgi:hypothetical protein